jgi:uncharacterized protein (TIGR00725 family)
MPDRYVAVIGPGSDDRRAEQLSEEVGRLLALSGDVLVCGGLGGAMEAACRGAKSEGGRTVGILPGDSRTEANPYLDVAITTGLGEARNVLVVRAADGVVAVRGGFGTLSEIGFALRIGKPVVGLDTWTVSRDNGPAIEQYSAAEEAVKALLGRLQ